MQTQIIFNLSREPNKKKKMVLHAHAKLFELTKRVRARAQLKNKQKIVCFGGTNLITIIINVHVVVVSHVVKNIQRAHHRTHLLAR